METRGDGRAGGPASTMSYLKRTAGCVTYVCVLTHRPPVVSAMTKASTSEVATAREHTTRRKQLLSQSETQPVLPLRRPHPPLNAMSTPLPARIPRARPNPRAQLKWVCFARGCFAVRRIVYGGAFFPGSKSRGR